MIYFLNQICTILKPMPQENGRIEFEDFGDYFCKIERQMGPARYSRSLITHKAKNITVDGVQAGCLLITSHHNYSVVSVDREKEVLDLVII